MIQAHHVRFLQTIIVWRLDDASFDVLWLGVAEGSRLLARAIAQRRERLVLAVRAVKCAGVLVRHAVATADERLVRIALLVALGAAANTLRRKLELRLRALRELQFAQRAVGHTVRAADQGDSRGGRPLADGARARDARRGGSAVGDEDDGSGGRERQLGGGGGQHGLVCSWLLVLLGVNQVRE